MPRFVFPLLVCLLLCSCHEVIEEEADERFSAAESALRAGAWDEADESFYETILLDPDRAEAWIGRGMTLTRLGEFEGARSHYEEALLLFRRNRKPNTPETDQTILHKEIMLLVLLGREEEARGMVENLSENTEIDSTQAQLHALIDQLQLEFNDMILPPASDDSVPIVDQDPPRVSR